ncbi:MAG: carbohydrate porin [Cytophagaceae bacterium]
MIRLFLKSLLGIAMVISTIPAVFGQTVTDSSAKWNIHFQQTIIPQYHPAFKAPYSDTFSLQSPSESQSSFTSTIFFGAKLWKGAEAYFNPEIAGGSGFSQARGVAGFPNGETFRIGNPAPQIYLARLYISQVISCSREQESVEDDLNQLPGKLPRSYIRVSAGKFSIADFFDNNQYSHDPRTQFMNWAFMSHGAWDYPANTRGYTIGVVTEFVRPQWALRISSVMVPATANGNKFDKRISDARSETMELEKSYQLFGRPGTFRILGFFTQARMGNYRQAVLLADTAKPDITATRMKGRTKYGLGINLQQELNDYAGLFARASWNDGRNETWAFTEIDRSVSIGLSLNGNGWKRKEDVAGFALAVNGISPAHRDYLKAGGHGFMIGDGHLNYANELIWEFFYNFHIHDRHFWITPGYQYIVNPAYNKDRGPVHVFSLRIHAAF